MRIAVNATFLENDHAAASRFIQECFKRIAVQYTEDEFFFIGNELPDNLSNIKPFPLLNTPSKITLRRKLWYNRSLPNALKKNKIDLIIHADKTCSLKTSVPQILLVPSLPLKLSWLQKKMFQQSLQKASSIIVPSLYLQNKLYEKYGIGEENIKVIHPAAYEIQLADHEKHNIKQHYTGGKEFFLYVGHSLPVTGFTNLLKGFSLFKKMQKSNMLLLILTKTNADMQVSEERIKTYKYRDEIKVIVGLSEKETAEIIASAYAFVYPSFYEESGIQVLQVMKCHTPVIVSSLDVLQELCGDAALYMSPDSPEQISERMILLYKDERSRSTLIKRAIKRTEQYNWDQTARELWKMILTSTKH
jgi:glycosyltransferase involved in cell wall biosynthesis